MRRLRSTPQPLQDRKDHTPTSLTSSHTLSAPASHTRTSKAQAESESASAPQDEPKSGINDEEAKLLRTQQIEMERALNSPLDLGDDDDDDDDDDGNRDGTEIVDSRNGEGNEDEQHRRKRARKYHEYKNVGNVGGEGGEQENEGVGINYGKVPLIDVWVARAKGLGRVGVEGVNEGFGGMGDDGGEKDESDGEEEQEGGVKDKSNEEEGVDGRGKGIDECEVGSEYVPPARVLELESMEGYAYMCRWEMMSSSCDMPLPDEDDPDL